MSITRTDVETMVAICKRFEKFCDAHDWILPQWCDRTTRMMDLEHAHDAAPINLAALLAAPDDDFVHDVQGIHNHMDRSTGKLGDCFSPRFTISQ